MNGIVLNRCMQLPGVPGNNQQQRQQQRHTDNIRVYWQQPTTSDRQYPGLLATTENLHSLPATTDTNIKRKLPGLLATTWH